MIRILIADDHPIMRRGLKQLIDAEGDMQVVAEAKDGRTVIEMLDRASYDALVLDISMPGVNGIEVLKHIKDAKMRVPVLVLTILPEERYAARIMAAGAAGYMTKDAAPEQLIDAIRKVARGSRYLSETATNILVDGMSTPRDRARHETLSDRELYVLMKLAKGESNKSIAAELFLSSKTISTYRTRILSKLGLKSTSDIIRYAIDNDLVEP